MSEKLGIDEFMTHSTSTPKGAYLSKWKDRSPPKVNTVLHKKADIYVLWRHQLPRIVIIEKDNEKHVWGGNYVCWESESLLKKQFKRLDDDTRVVPPETCPLCKMIEWTYQSILDGKIEWTTEMFSFESDDPKESRTIHAGGICNMFGKDDLSDDEKKDLKKHGIYQQDAWKENAWAKASYLLQVVDVDEPSAGVQIAIESSLLGDKVRTVISDRRMSLGKDRGDPTKNPYVIQWEHNPARNIAFNKKYHARLMDGMEITEQVMALIDGDPQDVANIIKRFNALELRAQLEEAAVMEIPWDNFFGKLEARVSGPSHVPGNEYKGAGKRPADLTDHAERPGEVGTTAGTSATADTDRAPAPEGDEEVDCDECNQVMKMSDKKCPHCGHVYIVEEPTPPPPQERRKRGQAAPSASLAPPAMSKSQERRIAAQTEGKAKESGAGGGAFPGLPADENDVPFAHCDEALMGAERWWR